SRRARRRSGRGRSCPSRPGRAASCRPAARRVAAPRVPAPPWPLREPDLAGRGAPLLGERRALRAVERDLEDAEAEKRALEPYRGEGDADLLEQLVLRHRR